MFCIAFFIEVVLRCWPCEENQWRKYIMCQFLWLSLWRNLSSSSPPSLIRLCFEDKEAPRTKNGKQSLVCDRVTSKLKRHLQTTSVGCPQEHTQTHAHTHAHPRAPTHTHTHTHTHMCTMCTRRQHQSQQKSPNLQKPHHLWFFSAFENQTERVLFTYSTMRATKNNAKLYTCQATFFLPLT